jgi:hypothetical protein
MSNVERIEQECSLVIDRYRWDQEAAHIHEDDVVYNAFREVVEAINKTSDQEELERLKTESKRILECIKKMLDKTRDIKWYA